ncbi:hypothetical protein [Panacagrimonas perspica]|nr:hypothetical protein [Panacagrimonas perspica]
MTTPIPTIKRVKVSDVRQHLLLSTPKVSAEQRQQVLRARADSVTRRGIE